MIIHDIIFAVPWFLDIRISTCFSLELTADIFVDMHGNKTCLPIIVDLL